MNAQYNKIQVIDSFGTPSFITNYTQKSRQFI